MAARLSQLGDESGLLGPPGGWPAPLRTLLSVILASKQPMFLVWGARRVWLYNDAFIPILGHKHPHALGQPSAIVWAEAWEFLEPLFERVFAGDGVHMEDFAVPLDRHGRIEEAHFAFSYTPVRDDEGRVAGLFGTCMETTSRALAQRQRQEYQERQRRLFEQAPGFIAILSGAQHVCEFANAACRRAAGDRDVLGRSVREALPELEGQGVFERLDKVYSTGERYIAEGVALRLRPSAGGTPLERHLDFIYEPIRDEAGAVTGIFIEGHDVTDAYLAKQAVLATERRQALLLELDDRLRELGEPAEVMAAAAGLLGRALEVSRAGYGLVDLAAETITIERDWTAPGVASLAGVLHFRDYGTYIENLKRGETVVFDDAFVDPRTRATATALQAITAVAVVNLPLREEHGFAALLYLNHATARHWTPDELLLVREVAERTRSVEQRRRAEKELRALTLSLERLVAERTAERDRVWRNSRDLLVVIGADGILRAVNPAWTAILGHRAEDVPGHSFLDFIWPDDAPLTEAALFDAVNTSDLTDFENRYRHLDGTPRWLSWHTAVDGELVYAYGRDITAAKAQARALEQAEAALRQSQRLEAMGQLTGGVAHDFNNLLAIVSNNLFVHKRLSPACEHSAQLAGIARATDTGSKLTRQLLAFSRQQAIRPTVVDLRQELPDLRQVLQATLGAQYQLQVECAPDTPVVNVDRAELELALINLAVNARDAMPDGGTLRIAAFRGAVARGEPGAAEAGEARIEVSDTGHGIPPALLARVLEPFFTTKAPGHGTGLGLSQVYGFVTQAGGRLELASEQGVSTTVTLRLPGLHGDAAEPALAEAPAGAPTAAALRIRILFVEDNEDVAVTTRSLLEQSGCDVIAMASADRAVEWLAANPRDAIDIVLSDIAMPGRLNGVALARWIARTCDDLPVLLCTGYSSEMIQASEQGFRVLQKPVPPQALIAALRDTMDRRRAT